MALPLLLLAMQASGMAIDWLGKREQIKMGRLGEKLEQASINSNIMASRLEAEDASLNALVQLRKNLGTQAAMFAARGTRAGAGNALGFMTESFSNFNADERIRKISQLGRETELRAGSVLSKLHQQTRENTIWGEFRKSIFDKIPTSPDAYKSMGSSFGLSKVGSS